MDNLFKQRRSIRRSGYDYTQSGAYFVTVCIERRLPLLAFYESGELRLNESGKMVEDYWFALPSRFSHIVLDEYIVMPTHFHGIVILTVTDAATQRATTRVVPTLGDVVGAWKSLTTNAYIKGVEEFEWPTFSGRLWQRNYYERIIRSELELDAIREYIAANPARWERDPENPETA